MKKSKILVLAGQSNAVGCGFTDCLNQHFDNNRIRKWIRGYRNIQINYHSHGTKSDGFVPTSLMYGDSVRRTFGPEIGIAETLDRRYPGENIYIVKCAFGGMSLHRDWLSPSGGNTYDPSAYANQKQTISDFFTDESVRAGWCYNELVKILSDSIVLIEKSGFRPVIKAFYWMQGESDADTPEHASQYISLYDALLSDFNTQFAGYLDECFYLDAGISTIWPQFSVINRAKQDFAASRNNCLYIDTIVAGLTTANEPETAPDIYHYDSDSVIKLGHLFAEQTVL